MQKIPLYTQTSNDWSCNNNSCNKPLAVDLNVGTNEYIFGRVTPDNKFIVSTGLINDPKPHGVQMVGGKKNKKGGSVYDSFKTTNNIFDKNNYIHNELIYNALDKINKLTENNKNDLINAQNNISGGSKNKINNKNNILKTQNNISGGSKNKINNKNNILKTQNNISGGSKNKINNKNKK